MPCRGWFWKFGSRASQSAIKKANIPHAAAHFMRQDVSPYIMKIILYIIIVLSTLDCFSQIYDAETGEIVDSIKVYMGEDDLPQDLINISKSYPDDSISWVTLRQKEYSGNYLFLDSNIYCSDSKRCYSQPLSVDIATFQVLNSTTYSKDKFKVYSFVSLTCEDCECCCGVCACDIFVLEKANPDSFMIINEPYTTDKEHVYYFGSLIAEADYKTFEILKDTTGFSISIDKENVYLNGGIIDGADPKTLLFDFVKKNEKYLIRDKNNYWTYYLKKREIIQNDD